MAIVHDLTYDHYLRYLRRIELLWRYRTARMHARILIGADETALVQLSSTTVRVGG